MRTRPVHRRDGTETAVMAADKILPCVSGLQARILKVIRHHYRETNGDGMTDGELERLPEFADCGYSSVRKRAGELRNAGYLRWPGETRDGMGISEPVPIAELIEQQQARSVGRLF